MPMPDIITIVNQPRLFPVVPAVRDPGLQLPTEDGQPHALPAPEFGGLITALLAPPASPLTISAPVTRIEPSQAVAAANAPSPLPRADPTPQPNPITGWSPFPAPDPAPQPVAESTPVPALVPVALPFAESSVVATPAMPEAPLLHMKPGPLVTSERPANDQKVTPGEAAPGMRALPARDLPVAVLPPEPPSGLPFAPPPAPLDRYVAMDVLSDPAPDTFVLSPVKVSHPRVRPNDPPDRTPHRYDVPLPVTALAPSPAPPEGVPVLPRTAVALPGPAEVTTETTTSLAGAGTKPTLVHLAPEPAVPIAAQHQPTDHTDDDAPPPPTPAATPLVVATAPLKPPSQAAAPLAVEQVLPVLVSIANRPGDVQHMTLQLQPDGLGHLQIQIDLAPNYPIRIRIETERPETLVLLQRDTPRLQQALDQAGVPKDIMTLSFHPSQAVVAAPTAQDTGQTSSQFLGAGQPHQGFGEGRPQRLPLLPFESREDPGTPNTPVQRAVHLRSGVDITA